MVMMVLVFVFLVMMMLVLILVLVVMMAAGADAVFIVMMVMLMPAFIVMMVMPVFILVLIVVVVMTAGADAVFIVMMVMLMLVLIVVVMMLVLIVMMMRVLLCERGKIVVKRVAMLHRVQNVRARKLIPRRGNNHPCGKPSRPRTRTFPRPCAHNAPEAAQNAPCPRRARQTARSPTPKGSPHRATVAESSKIGNGSSPGGSRKRGAGRSREVEQSLFWRGKNRSGLEPP